MAEQIQVKPTFQGTEPLPYSDRRCPVCERGKFAFLLSNVDRYYFKRGTIFDLYCCSECGYVELDCPRDPEVVSSFYPSSDYYSYQDQSKLIELKTWVFGVLFRKLPPLASLLRDIVTFPLKQGLRGIEIVPGGKLFDVGCGSGKFLAIAKGLGMKPYGLDINPKACEAAKRITPNIACEFVEDFPGFFEGNEKVLFDVITANQVVEHALDPLPFLENLASSLKPKGTMIIGTPNIGSPVAKLFGRFWLGLETPRHLSLFTPENFEMLCAKIGLKVVRARHNFNGYTAVYSLLFMLEELIGKRFSDSFRNRSATIGKYILFPICMVINLLGMSDSVDYYVQKA